MTVALYNNDTEDDNYYTQPPAFHHFQTLYNEYDDSWFGIALDSFDAEIEVEIDLSANANGDYTISLLKKSATVDGIGVAIEFQLYMTASASAEMSFTAGLELSVRRVTCFEAHTQSLTCHHSSKIQQHSWCRHSTLFLISIRVS